jgi:hypothetical protein
LRVVLNGKSDAVRNGNVFERHPRPFRIAIFGVVVPRVLAGERSFCPAVLDRLLGVVERVMRV